MVAPRSSAACSEGRLARPAGSHRREDPATPPENTLEAARRINEKAFRRVQEFNRTLGPAGPPPDTRDIEDVRAEAAARVDELEGFFDELIAHLKAIQEAHTDEWEKPWP